MSCGMATGARVRRMENIGIADGSAGSLENIGIGAGSAGSSENIGIGARPPQGAA